MQWLRDLAVVAVNPRDRIREILQRDRVRVLPLVIAAVCASFIGNANVRTMKFGVAVVDAKTLAIIIGISIMVFAVMIGVFYLAAAAVAYTARFLEGTGDYRRTQVAMAWGLAPVIWSLLFRIPYAFLRPAVEVHDVGSLQVSVPAGGALYAGIAAIVSAIAVAWTFFVMSETIGEVHQFSGWRGLGALLIVGAAPFVVLLAAVLALNT